MPLLRVEAKLQAIAIAYYIIKTLSRSIFLCFMLILLIKTISVCLWIYKKKEIYQVNIKNFENCPKGFYIIFNFIGKKVDYFDKNFKKVITNFVQIETICLKYNTFFLFKLQRYKYLKANYIKTIQATLFSFT